MTALPASADPIEPAPLRPRDEADVAEIVAGTTRPLDVEGLGSKRGLGRPTGHRRLCVGALSGVIAYEPAELVLTARAATPISEIRALLAAHRQHLAFEPPSWGALFATSAASGAHDGREAEAVGQEGTIGGVIACNLAGSRRVTAGAARDHFLGFRAVNGRGEPFKAGGRVVKNVTGYDLPKLLAGSFGTLAVLTEVTIKVMPVPETRTTLLMGGLADDAATSCMVTALGSRHEVASAAHLPAEAARMLLGRAEPATLIRIEGPEPSTRARAALLTAELARYGRVAPLGADADVLWRDLGNGAPFAEGRGEAEEATLWRISVPPARGASVVAALRHAPDLYWYDWGGGLIWLDQPAGAEPNRVRAAAEAAGGHAMLVRGTVSLRRALGFLPPPDPALAALSARIKASFDPRSILGRGRLYESF